MAEKYLYSGAAGAGTGADWTNAYTTMVTAMAALAAGDTLWVAHDHNESAAAAKTWTSPGTLTSPVKVICVNRAVASGFTSSDLRQQAATGAVGILTTGGSASITMTPVANGCTIYYGLRFSAGSSTGNSSLVINNSTGPGLVIFIECHLQVGGSNAGSLIQFGATGINTSWKAILRNCSMYFAASGQSIVVNATELDWKNDDTYGSALASGSANPTTLFSSPTNNRTVQVTISGLDLNSWGNNTLFPTLTTHGARFVNRGCRLSSGATISGAQTAPGVNVISIRSASGATPAALEKHSLHGSQSVLSTVKRTGGDANGAWKINTAAGAKYLAPFEVLPLTAANTTTGSAVAATVYGIYNHSALPNDDEVWMDVSFMGNASYPLEGFESSGPTDILDSGDALTADTSAWDTGATARANSTAYSVGDIIKLASNSGRLFFCTTAGTSNGSEPAGYATAVDGGSVTDGTAVFRAGWRFKMTVTLTSPQLAGFLFAALYVGKASVNGTLSSGGPNLFIDPYLEAA